MIHRKNRYEDECVGGTADTWALHEVNMSFILRPLYSGSTELPGPIRFTPGKERKERERKGKERKEGREEGRKEGTLLLTGI
jgi:hypothetical protein